MSLVALDGTPLVAIGQPGGEAGSYLFAQQVTLIDAANEACIMIGQIFTEDGSSHTIDTTGSSSLGWRAGSVTFANAGTTVKVGLAAVDTTTGPPGRAVNVADVITFDVAAVFTGGGGGVTAAAWQESVPTTGTKTIANGDLVAFAVQMTARGGADSINVGGLSGISGASVMPFMVSFTGAAYSATSPSGRPPNAVITFSDGKYGFFYGSIVYSTLTTQTWNSGSATKEYGNYLQLPVPGKAYGIVANCSVGGDASFVFYSDPLGTPVAEKTVALDLNTVGVAANNRWFVLLFPSPYIFTAAQPLAVIMKPTTVTDISSPYISFNTSTHQKSIALGANGYAINRSSGAFAAQNSNKDRFAIGLLVGAFDAGGGGGLAANPLRGFVG